MNLVSVLTLALGIGANSLLFSLAYALLLRPAPLQDEERVGLIWRSTDRVDRSPFSIPTYRDIEQRQRVFEALALYRELSLNLPGGTGDPERLAGLMVRGEFLRAVGAEAVAGRGFEAEEDRLGASRTVMISQELWNRRYGADPALIGQDILLNNEPYTVVGIFSAGLRKMQLNPYVLGDFWVPMGLFWNQLPVDERESRQGTFGVARLKPQVGWQEATQDLDRIGRELKEEFPLTMSKSDLRLRPLRQDRVADVQVTVWLLQGTVGLVLLLACANLAHLMMLRLRARRLEFATRSALGAGRGRLILQSLTESILLSLLGGVVGLLLAFLGLRALPGLLPLQMMPADGLHLDSPVLLFTAALALLICPLLGLFPALRASRYSLGEIPAARFTARQGLRRWLISAEVAAALILTIGASLMLASLIQMGKMNPGFRPQGLLSLQLTLAQPKYSEASDWIGFLDRTLDQIEGIPAVDGVAAASLMPLVMGDDRSIVVAGDRPVPPVPQMATTVFQTVSPGFFRTLDIPLLAGRDFEPSDDERGGAEPVAVVNQSLARHFWPGQDAVGQQIAFEFAGTPADPQPQFRRIVGVVADVRHVSLLDNPLSHIYTSHRQPALWYRPEWPTMVLAVRTAVPPFSLTGAIRERLSRIDPDQPIYAVQSVEEAVAAQAGRQRLVLGTLSGFAVLTLILALLGVYGAVSASVISRTREIGTRMALGARPAQVMLSFFRQTLFVLLLGLAIGLLAAAGLSRFMSSLLVEVDPLDPLSYVLPTLLLLAMGLTAALLPSRRASRIDPVRALRYE